MKYNAGKNYHIFGRILKYTPIGIRKMSFFLFRRKNYTPIYSKKTMLKFSFSLRKYAAQIGKFALLIRNFTQRKDFL